MYTPDYDLTNKTWNKSIKGAFPGFMDQKPHSTNQRILKLIAKIANIYKNDTLKLSDQLNIENASGEILTDIGKDYGITRIDNDDEFLRFEIKFQMWKTHLGAGRNDFNSILHFILGVSSNQFNVTKTGTKEFKITNVPWNFDSGDKEELKRSMLTSIVQSVAPPEFKLDYIEYYTKTYSHEYYGAAATHTLLKRDYPKPMTLFKRFINTDYSGNLAYSDKKMINKDSKPKE